MHSKQSELGSDEFVAVSELFSVLADPTRLKILHTLKQNAAYVNELCERTGLKQPNVSKHLVLMHRVGLVKRERRGNQIQYSIGDDFVFELCDLVCEKLHRTAQSRAKMIRHIFS